MLITGAMFNVGWYVITRGEWQILPDGTKVYKGKIFKGWSKFWEQETETFSNKIYYHGGELRKLVIQIEAQMGMSTQATSPDRKYSLVEGENSIWLPNTGTIAYFNDRWWVFGHNNDVSMVIKKHGLGAYVNFFKLKKTYRFPEWVRMPVSSCIFCYSSIYGSLFWWLNAIISNRLGWLANVDLNVFLVYWVPYCISLSFLSPFLWQKLKK